MTALSALARDQVRAWLEEAAAAPLRVDDPLPDSLVACAQEAGLTAPELRLFVFDQTTVNPSWYFSGGPPLSARLAAWARRRNVRLDEEETHG